METGDIKSEEPMQRKKMKKKMNGKEEKQNRVATKSMR